MSNPFSDAATGRTVVLGHDWLTGMRGGERLLEMHCETFPKAAVATLIYNQSSVSETINSRHVVASWLNRIPGIYGSYRNFLPLMPSAARSLRIPDADIMITTSHCVAKSFRKPVGSKHLCCCFTPMRYAWLFRDEYFGKNSLKGIILAPLLAYMRKWDKQHSAEVDRFVAISRAVADRISRFYGRESDVVYPFVDTARCTPSPGGWKRDATYDLIVSALVPYKRVDLAVKVYSEKGWPLKVVGSGGDMEKLKAIAGPTVEFTGRLPDEAVTELYRKCRLLIFPGEEDFGIVPLEAQACGRPVVAFAKGGALETVSDGVSGVLFSEQTSHSLADAVERAAEMNWDAVAIRAHAEKFGPDQYLSGMARSLSEMLRQ